MNIKPHTGSKPQFGIVGHVGVGHVHSHSGFIQDDSGGFAVTVALINIAFPADTSILSVACEENRVVVQTADGGVGSAEARRGFTRHEEELMQRALGKDGVYSQPLACHCFGRIYGQGVMEAAVAFQTAICLAVVDTFKRKYPGEITTAEEGLECNVGKCMAALVSMNQKPVAVMAVVNATRGGVGPVEDLEGNISLASKGALMEKYDLHKIPTIIVEGKAYIPGVSSGIRENSFWVRCNEKYDNPAVGDALTLSAASLQLQSFSSREAYSRHTGEMRDATRAFGQKVVDIGQRIISSGRSQDKVRLVAELAVLVSQDAGGITYMTDSLHDIAAGGGLIPGLASVLSLVVSPQYIRKYSIPELTPDDVDNYIQIISGAVDLMSGNYSSVEKYIKRRNQFNVKILGESILNNNYSTTQ